MDYFICTVQRSGSNLLCDLLSRTGVAGHPTEYFHPAFPGDSATGHLIAGFEESVWAKQNGVTTFELFVQTIRRITATPNGVFGAKLTGNALDPFLDRLGRLPECADAPRPRRLLVAFEGARLIHLRRRDTVRQAISWALASQTGHYSANAARLQEPFAAPRYDRAVIAGLHRRIIEDEKRWRRYFASVAVVPFVLDFEDMIADLNGSLAALLEWMELPQVAPIDPSTLSFQPQGSALNDEWAERFRIERRRWWFGWSRRPRA